MNQIQETEVKERQEIEGVGMTIYQISQSLIIVDSESYKMASTILQNIKGYISKAKEFCRPNIARWYDGWKKALADEKKLISPYENAEKIIKPKIALYLDVEEKKRRQEEERLQHEAQKLVEDEALERAAEAESAGFSDEAEAILDEPPEVAPVILASSVPKVNGVSSRKIWKFRIKDPAKIQRDFLIPDEKKILGVVRSMARDAERLVGGIEVYQETVISGRQVY